MNLREGTRRLALLLGVAGAIAAGFYAYILLYATLQQRSAHQRFQVAANRIERLGRAVQNQYPVYTGMDASDVGWRVLTKYPQFWPWVSGRTNLEPELPKAWSPSAAPNREQTDPWQTAAKQTDWRIWGITTPDGQTFLPTPAPSEWSYLLILLTPIGGFIVPWGIIRAIGWVVAGFANQ